MTGVADGVHTYTATATDAATNTSPASAGRTITIDKVRPLVSSTVPTAGASAIAVGANVTATFSEAMTAASLTTTSFSLAPTAGGSAVPASVAYNAATQVATLDPSAALVAGVSYTATITTAAADLAGNTLLAAHTWTFTTAPAADTTPPTVSSRTPLAAATNVGVSTNVTATFSEPVTGVSGTSFTLEGPGTTPVGAVVTYDGPSRTATLNPSADLAANTTYTARLTGAITDTAATPNALAPLSWTFTTAPAADTTPPTVSSRTPLAAATNVGVSTNVTATFSEPVTGVSGTSFTLEGPGTTPVGAVVTYDGPSRTATLNPSADLAANTTYTARLTGAITDTAATPNALAPLSWTFTTAPAADTTPPTVSSRTPLAAATNVGVSTNVTATFSEPVTGVSGTSFTLEGPGTTPVGAVVTYDGPSRTATLNPSADLAANTTYTARLTGAITDTAATPNALAPLSWTFTTAAAPPPGAITFRGASSAANATATTLVLPKPAGVVSGDVLLAAVAARGGPAITPPAGWTLVRLDPNGSTLRQAVYVHVAGGAEPATYTFTLASAQSAGGGISAYTGVDTDDPDRRPWRAGRPDVDLDQRAVDHDERSRPDARRLLRHGRPDQRHATGRPDRAVRPGRALDQPVQDHGRGGRSGPRPPPAPPDRAPPPRPTPASTGPRSPCARPWTATAADTTPPTVSSRTPLAAATKRGRHQRDGHLQRARDRRVGHELHPGGPGHDPGRRGRDVRRPVAHGDPQPVGRSGRQHDLHRPPDRPAITDTAATPNALAPVSWTFTTAPAADTTPPTVSSRTPLAAATNVGVSTNVTATFSEPVTGVSGTSFTLEGPGTTPVGAVVTYDGPSRTATLNPSADLAANTTYTARLTGAITDTAATPNALAPLSWTFTTAPAADTTPPTVSSRTPLAAATNVGVGTNVTATFSEPVTGVWGTSFTLEGPGTTPVGAVVTYDGPSRTATLNPSADLAANTTYTARLTGAITDTAATPNALAPVSWTFTTAAAPPPGAITFRSASSAANATATTLVLPTPAGVVTGDVLLASVAARGGPAITPPAGWTLVRLDANGSTLRQAVYVHMAGGAEPATYTFTLASAQSATGGISAYTGVDTTTPIDAHGGQVAPTSTSISAPSITTSGPDRMLVGFFATAVLTSVTPPAGQTERFDQAVPSTNQFKITAAAADRAQAATGASGPRTATSANTGVNVGALVALRPGAGGPPPPDTTPPTVSSRTPRPLPRTSGSAPT